MVSSGGVAVFYLSVLFIIPMLNKSYNIIRYEST